MNPGQLNRRIIFTQLTNTKNEYGGTTSHPTTVLETWGSLSPIRQYNQIAIEAGASAANGDIILIIRYRNSFQPAINMLFMDEQSPQIVYTIKSILPYYPGTKVTFENASTKPYQNKLFIYIVGVKTDNSWINGSYS